MGRAALFGAIAILLFDTVASLASRALGFPYGAAAIGSWIIYALTGAYAARSGRIRSGLSAGAVVGLVEATVGWWISVQIGPGMPPEGMPTPWGIAVTVVIVTLLAAAVGTMGAFLRVAWPTRSGSAV